MTKQSVVNKQDKKIVVIGGGTGSFTILSSLKEHTSNITALVNMADDGGSTGVLRDELGVLPPGDVRQCLVALSDSSKTRDLFNFRFGEGSLKGHNFGNLFISAVEKMTNSFDEAVSLASEVLQITGRVLPITTDKAQLVLTGADGAVTKKQFKIGNMDFGKNKRPVIALEPVCSIYPGAEQAILDADIVVIAPGNLYGSLAPALIVKGVGESLERTKATVAYVCNLVTKPHQTDGFMVHDYAAEIERFAGRPILDSVIYNTDHPPAEVMSRYAREDEYVVQASKKTLQEQHYKSIGVPLIAEEPAHYDENDAIASSRSLIRHDGEALAKVLLDL